LNKNIAQAIRFLIFLETMVSMIEVKNQLFNQGMAYTHPSTRSANVLRSKAKAYIIVTDSTIWQSIKCTIDRDRFLKVSNCYDFRPNHLKAEKWDEYNGRFVRNWEIKEKAQASALII